MTPTELKSFCHSALTEAQAKGYRIVDDTYVSRECKCCCLIGALALKLGLDSYWRGEVAYNLGIETSSLTALEHGFMAVNGTRHSHPNYAVGTALREEFKPTTFFQ